MNKNEIKKILKPLIKECIKEVVFEEKGALSHIISEVVDGLHLTKKQVVTESLPKKKLQSEHASRKNVNDALKEHKKKLLDAIGAEAYGGINIFEGTTPAPSPAGNGNQGALSGLDPKDPGVDISNIFGNKSSAIFNKMMGKK
jgi:hypothetical protein